MKKRLVSLLILVLVIGSAQAAADFSYTADVQKVELDNGLTILLKENPAFDIIAMGLVSAAGSVHDPEGLEGLTFLTQRNLLSGTTNRSAQELVIELESLGAQLQTAASYDYAALLFQSTPGSFEAGFAVLMDVLANSTFPEVEFERERMLSQAALASLTDDPMNALVLGYLELFYGAHPYKYSPYGSPAGLASISRQDVTNWQKYIYQPEHVVVSVVGNFDSEELLPLLREGFGDWESGYSAEPAPREQAEFVYPAENREMVINLPTEAAFLIMGYPAPASFDADSAAMAVINGILGEGMSSRLFTEIRDKRGLAYTAISQYDERLGPSNLLIFLATHPQNVEQAREQVLAELGRFAVEGLTEAEIAHIATLKRGTHLIQNETNMNQATMLALAEVTGRGYEWVDEYMNFFAEVTPEDIKAAAQKYFHNYTEVLIIP
ncbi:MAG: insulinase family protein [Firmicutes bacterium]|nr:insulinase family protein [Bacillota bacterium]